MSATTYSDLKELGDRFYKAKKWEQAIKAYEEAEEVDPSAAEEDGDFCFNRGFALIELTRWADAQYAFEQCTAVAPENGAAWTNLGLCHRNLEDWQEGLTAYETATEVAPGMINAWKGLAICAEKLNNKAQRISACEELVELLPDDSYWRNELGRAHLASGESSGACSKALKAFLESASLGNDPSHPNNAAVVFRKLNKWLDAGDAYREALHRKPGYAPSEKGLEEIKQRLEKLSAKVRDFAANLPPCKQPYERYLNPFEILALNGRLAEMPDGAALRKLKQRVIQQIQLNDGRADWLEGAEIGESRVRQILDDLDDESGMKPRWHWVIYECPDLNRFLSHGAPLYFAFFTAPFAPKPLARPPYWQMRDKTGDEKFFQFIHSPFLANFEGLLAQALDLNDPELVQALSSGRLPPVDAFDYFRRANKWMEAKAAEIKGYLEGLGTPEGINWWKQTPDPMAWFSVPLANALPDECKGGRTELGRALRSLGIALHNEHALTDQALKATSVASQLLVDEGLADQLKKDKAELERILKERKQEEAEAARWNIIVKIRSDEIEINKAFIRYNDTKIATESVTGIRFGVFKQYTNGIPTHTSYAIEACGAGRSVSIECKRMFRSETQAQEDFTALLNALSHQILPTLVIGLAEKIATGASTQQVGPLLLTKHGVQCETGSLWWKKQLTIPYAALSFSDYQGHVHVSAKQPESVSFSMDRRAVWNAVIVEKLVEIIKLIQSQAKK